MKEIKRFLDSRIGVYSFYFEDLDSGYTYGFNEKVKMPSAGCIKIPIAIALMKEVENGRLSLETTVQILEEDMIEGCGIIHEFVGREYTLRELMTAMLIQSDNTAAKKIIDLLTIEHINGQITEMGLKNTILKAFPSNKKLEMDEMENASSSYDLAKCLKLLFKKKFLKEENCKLILDLLKRQQIKDKIPFYFPQNEKESVVNKSGSLRNIENDMALIQIEKGNFILTVLSKDLPNNVYGTLTVAKIGKMMWDIIDKDWK